MRRYGSLSVLAKLRLLALFVCVQAIVWIFFSGIGLRLSAAVLTAAVLMVGVKTRKPTPR